MLGEEKASVHTQIVLILAEVKKVYKEILALCIIGNLFSFRKFNECLLHVRPWNPVILQPDGSFSFFGWLPNLFLASVDSEGPWSGLTTPQAGDRCFPSPTKLGVSLDALSLFQKPRGQRQVCHCFFAVLQWCKRLVHFFVSFATWVL